MSAAGNLRAPRMLRGGLWGPLLVAAFVVLVVVLLVGLYAMPQLTRDYGRGLPFDHAMFGPMLEQPIAFSHRLHVTDKEIDCRYCHPFAERSLNAGLPSAEKCLGCHDHIIPHHEEIARLRGFVVQGEGVPWVRVYYNPDHVFFPHYRHIQKELACAECHGEVERVDRLREVTFYMGFCLNCHRGRGASLECVACHQ